MDQRYNLYNLEASFKQYLLAGNRDPVTVKNYLSDLRHFLGWLALYLKSGSFAYAQDDIIRYLTHQMVEDYKSYLLSNGIPTATVNRRLSTVRKFCSFCISQGWMKENPAKKVSNVILHQNDILSQFKNTVDHSVFADVKEFFQIISS